MGEVMVDKPILMGVDTRTARPDELAAVLKDLALVADRRFPEFEAYALALRTAADMLTRGEWKAER